MVVYAFGRKREEWIADHSPEKEARRNRGELDPRKPAAINIQPFDRGYGFEALPECGVEWF